MSTPVNQGKQAKHTPPSATGVIAPQHEQAAAEMVATETPLAATLPRFANTATVEGHAQLLRQAGTAPSAAQTALFQSLQGSYGNAYVQRVLAVARKADDDQEVTPDVEASIQRARSGGQPLDRTVRGQMEETFGSDLSHVRVHTDGEADHLNQTLSARAFTVGGDIFFRQGAYNPGAASGRELIAHEMTHVVQQGQGQVRAKLTVNQPGDKFEQEADTVARAVIQAEQVAPATTTAPNVTTRQVEEEEAAQLQRQPEEEEEPVAQPIQRQATEEEESARPQLQRQDNEEEESLQEQLQRQPEEEDETIQAPLQRQLEGDEATTQPQLQHRTGEDEELLLQRLQRKTKAEEEGTAQPLAAEMIAYRAGYEQVFSRLAIQRQPSTDTGTAEASSPAGEPINLQTQTRLPTVEQAARDLTLWFAMPNPGAHREEIFRAMLLLKGRGEELKQAFQENAGRDLMEAIDVNLSQKDAIRAKRYLQYGTLRLADKIFFATKEGATDEETLYRLVPQVRANLKQVDTDFIVDYGQDYATDGKLPNGQVSRIAGVLDDEMSGWELDKAKALLAYGELRPEDEIRIATNRPGTDESMLFAALERSNKDRVRQEYLQSYGEDLDALLASELSGDDKKRADLILSKKLTAFEKIRMAVEGLGTDEQALFDAIAKAEQPERDALAREFGNKGSELYKLLADDLSETDLKRVEALLKQGSQDTALQQLQQAGALEGSDLIKAIKMSSGSKFQKYQKEYNTVGSEFSTYILEHTSSGERSDLEVILNGTAEGRLEWAMEGAGTDEEYIFHILEKLIDDNTKQSLAANTQVMEDLESDLNTRDYNRVKELLRPSNLGIEQRVASTQERIEAERSWITDLVSNASDALGDENRELQAALDRSRADGKLDAEEQAEIARLQSETESSLEVYKTVRDEIEDTAATVLSTTAAIVIGVLSAGTLSGASAAIIAAQLSQAALASAVAKVLAMKVAKGDRFDVFGADGAIAFGSGAIDGVLNVVGAGAAKGLVSPAFGAVSKEVAEQTAVGGFRTIGRELLTKAVEGSISGSGSAIFESAANEATWKNGFADGIGNLALSGGMAIGIGAASGVGMHFAGKGYSAVSERISGGTVGAIEEGEQALTHGATGKELGADPRSLIDPHTGRPLGSEPVTLIDPHTGKPFGAEPEPLINPATNKPFGAKPEPLIDPNTGKPISEASTVAPPASDKIGPASGIPEHTGAFLERGYFNKTNGKGYLVRAGPPGSYGDHLFESLAEAEAYARQLASTGEAAIRETSALPRIWPGGAEGNPVDAIRVFEVPPDTPYIQGVVSPQMEGGAVHGAPVTYQGGGPQVVIDRGVRLGEPVREFPVTDTTLPGASPVALRGKSIQHGKGTTKVEDPTSPVKVEESATTAKVEEPSSAVEIEEPKVGPGKREGDAHLHNDGVTDLDNVIHFEYEKELAEFPKLTQWIDEIQALRVTNPDMATKEMASLVSTLKLIRSTPGDSRIAEFINRGGRVRVVPSTSTRPKPEQVSVKSDLPSELEGIENVTNIRTRTQAGVGLAEDHHIATRYSSENRKLFESHGYHIDNDMNLIKDFSEHAQQRGWYGWNMTTKKLEYHMRGHHPEYNKWVTRELKSAVEGLSGQAAADALMAAEQRLALFIKEHPDILVYGPDILKGPKAELTPVKQKKR